MTHYREERDAYDDARGKEYERTHKKEIEQRARKTNRRKALHKELTEKYPELMEYLDLCNDLK